MTVRLVREQAKELAGAFYEDNRTPGFRKAFPTLKSYMLGRWHLPDGRVKQEQAGWIHHVVLARKLLALMLGRTDVTQHMKDQIYKALLEDREQATTPRRAENITQRIETHH